MKGILFTPDNHKAIREGRKTVTRRVFNPQPELTISVEQFKDNLLKCGRFPHTGFGQRYTVGEVVYIKEAFATEKAWDDKPMSFFDGAGDVPIWYKIADPLLSDFVPRGKWRSPLFMPAWAARDFIKITGVRAERLQEITYGDCMAEGLDMSDVDYKPGWDVSKYKNLWDSINKGHQWADNPWCFVYIFRLIDKPVGVGI